MLVVITRLSATALLGLAVLGSASPAIAQMSNPNPNFRLPGSVPGSQQAGATAVLGQSVVPPATGQPYQSPYAVPYGQPTITVPAGGGTATITSSPYGLTQTASGSGYNPYLPPVYDPAGGYLRGVADVTNANAQYQVTIQQARLAQSQADMSKLDLRRRLFDEARYERMMMPNPEDVRVALMTADLNKARREPPLTEIWSGKSLNDLYLHLASQQSKGNRGPNVPLDEDMLKRINLTTGVGGNVGILKDGGKLQWPLSLQGTEFQEARKRMEQHATELVQRLNFGNPPEVATLKDMQADMRRLNEALAKNVGDLSPSEFIEARRYLNHLDDAVKALQDPNVANFFTKKWTANGKTVAELVKAMSDQGLRFAAAAPGDEPAYRALHQALNAYDYGMAQLTAGQRP